MPRPAAQNRAPHSAAICPTSSFSKSMEATRLNTASRKVSGSISESPMNEDQLRTLLEEVRKGSTGVDAALERVRHLPFEDLGFANIDHHRALRHGIPEVVFAMGKTTEQVIAIASRLLDHQGNILITR